MIRHVPQPLSTHPLPVASPGLPLRPASDPEQKAEEARTGEARCLGVREKGSGLLDADNHFWPDA